MMMMFEVDPAFFFFLLVIMKNFPSKSLFTLFLDDEGEEKKQPTIFIPNELVQISSISIKCSKLIYLLANIFLPFLDENNVFFSFELNFFFVEDDKQCVIYCWVDGKWRNIFSTRIPFIFRNLYLHFLSIEIFLVGWEWYSFFYSTETRENLSSKFWLISNSSVKCLKLARINSITYLIDVNFLGNVNVYAS